MADIVAEETKSEALDITNPINEPVDILYFGSAVYATVVDWRVKKFIKTLTPDKVKSVICFSSAAIIESNYPKIRALFEQQGIKVDTRQFTCRGAMGPIQAGHPNQTDFDNLRLFIRSTLH
ncbi:MAG: hypothetical protein IJZ68_04255 [Bacteroidaceae bacterium]|nr:hypothetical protein [Bacteroidaceae bacterium]